ncbi:MAG: hypothetical protein MUC77_07395 [Chromatiaceae bacterium]|jgi:hypothetical protein|nr:hypothetical protein [Chromatiaceae bacterium]
MEYVIFAAAALLLAWSLPYWASRRAQVPGGSGLAPRLAGVLGHLGGALALGWLDGAMTGLAAFVTIPLVASVIHGLLIDPQRRARRLRGGGPRPSQPRREPTPADLGTAAGAGARAR